MDKSRLTIQRPEGCPEWAEIGVMVMVQDWKGPNWNGPFPLVGYRTHAEYPYVTSDAQVRYAKYARPFIKWKPEPGEWVAGWDENDTVFCVSQYSAKGVSSHFLSHGEWANHIARLVDDDGNLIDLRCTVEGLKERTEWL